ncbi:MAG: lipoyl synthase [Acidobacteria bacterium]|nr:lipoyl synthase [Acidobacteriota bacterium]
MSLEEVARGRKPPWLRVRMRLGPNFTDLKRIAAGGRLHTICEEASCPNIFECWEEREATFLVGGDRCTRRCAFCDVSTARPEDYDRDEPRRVAEAVARMGLRYAVITGVARDDLPDGGAWLYAECLRRIRARATGCGVELLVPDFRGSAESLQRVCDAEPEVLAHNVETVPRLFARIRPAFTYEGSLEVLRRARGMLPEGRFTKSNVIVGMGETHEEVVQAMADLRETGCDLLTVGQYLRPSDLQMPVARYVPQEEFEAWGEEGRRLGFAWVEAGPFVRSSYHAGRQHSAARGVRNAEFTSEKQARNGPLLG